MERFVQSKYTSQFPTHTIWMCQFNSDSIHLHSKSQSPKENWKYGFLWNILWPIKYKENPVAKRNPAKLASKNKGKVKWDTIWPGHTHLTRSQLWHSCSSYHVMPCQWIYFKAFIIQTDIANSVSIQFNSYIAKYRCKESRIFSIVWKLALVCRYLYWLCISYDKSEKFEMDLCREKTQMEVIFEVLKCVLSANDAKKMFQQMKMKGRES